MAAILHDRLPLAPWLDPLSARLPGTRPVDPGDWIRTDEAHAAQMALRDRLVEERPGDVLACLPGAEAAAAELLALTLAALRDRPGYEVGEGCVRRPDDVAVPVEAGRPMRTLARLVQEDLCILQKEGDTDVLTAAALLFPAGWTLAEKIGRPLLRIHAPVRAYDADVARRVQRLFDCIRPGRPLGRANAHLYDTAELFLPRRESDPRPKYADGPYLRSEWQVLFRLPETGAMVFSIHSYVLEADRLPPEQKAGLDALRPG